MIPTIMIPAMTIAFRRAASRQPVGRPAAEEAEIEIDSGA